MAELREMFIKLDTNSDGVLSFDEIDAGMQAIS